MPVSKVFNAAENQILFSPVTNYQEGKALRLLQRNRELANQALEQEIEMAPAEYELDKRSVVAREGELELAISKHMGDFNEDQREQFQDAAAAGLDALSRGEDANAAFSTALGSDELPEGFEFTEEVGRAILASGEEYQKAQGFNLQETAHQKVVEDLISSGAITREQGDKYLEAKAIKDTTVTGSTEFDPKTIFGATGDKVIDRKTREVVGGAENLLSSIDRIEKQVSSMSQSAMGAPAAVSSLVDNVSNAVIGFAELAGGTAQIDEQVVPESYLLDANRYIDMFSGPAANNAALQANAIGLAYTLARAANPDGRISDADVRHQIKKVPLSSSSKTQIQAAIIEVKREVMVNVANHLRVNGYTKTTDGKTYYDSLMKKIELIDVMPDEPKSTAIPSPITEKEYNAIPKGRQYKHPDGTLRIKE